MGEAGWELLKDSCLNHSIRNTMDTCIRITHTDPLKHPTYRPVNTTQRFILMHHLASRRNRCRCCCPKRFQTVRHFDPTS